MKLRIRGNSIRLRVSRRELDRIAEAGAVDDRVRFAPGSELTYRVAVAPGGGVGARFSGDELAVTLPKTEVQRWLAPDEVSIRGEQALDGGEALTILVEKDFECLTPRDEEDESDLFPNPARDG